ncbi:response regulator [Kitasatospora sp. YST-16]|uniref:response regulator n=1 Tax=Kitasatospora TaxID=2063 RepID=UPI00068B24AC|nr:MULTISPECIES: response regulator [unclassified Kitasatospora]WAL73841.1 response regulator [Kitasatospora sp. YST-16]WNW39918.1 response regulator [Streptomyces sp. Li-HN-5-13]
MAATSGRVLVVDDSEVIRQLIRVNLELEGFEVVTAADGAECLEVVGRVAPDVVTLDVVMPRLDGLRTAARLRAARETAHLPIAIVSACTPADLERGESVGVDGYLAKPFDPAELVALVRRLRVSAAGGRRFAYDFGGQPPAVGQTSRDSALGEQPQELVRPDEPHP